MPKNSETPQAYLYRQVVQAKLYIEAHYSEKINLEDISRKASFSKYHFLRLFKDCFKLTPNQFLTEVRLKNARKFLKKGQSVQDVCWEVGFESLSSFSLLFKRKFGVSPTLFSSQHFDFQKQKAAQPLHFVPGCFSQNFDGGRFATFDK